MFSFLKKKLIESKEKLVKKITEKNLTSEEVEELLEPLRLNLLQSNVALETVNRIIDIVTSELAGKSVKKKKAKDLVISALKDAISSILIEGDVNKFIKKIRDSENPVSIMFVGSNGSGKTTTIAKIAYFLKNKNISSVMAACDTFRAAAIQQLEIHGKALGIKVIKHTYGSDAAAVAYDALQHAKAKGIKAVLIDTAGRSHSNINLMKELEKIKRVVNPDIIVFVGDALTGNDVVMQCRDFLAATNFDYSILTKTDVDEKGGAILSVSNETGVPILFLGTGQGYGDLKAFKKDKLINMLFQ